MSRPPAATAPLGLWSSIAFSAPALPVAAFLVTVGVYVAPHYSGPLGLDIGLVGLGFMIVRLLDMPVDFLLGLAMDRTRSRFGRYKLWLAIGGPLMLVSVYFLYFAKPGVSLAYFVFWMLVVYVGYSILYLAHSAWASSLARTYDDRSRLYGVMAAVGVAGSSLALLAPDIVHWVAPAAKVGVSTMGGFIMLCVPLGLVLALWHTPETVAVERPHQPRFELRDYVSLITRPSMARVVLCDFFLSVGPIWTGAIYVFFFTDSRGFTSEQTRLLLVLYMLAGFFGAPLTARLAIAIGKHRAAMISIAAWGIILLALLIMPRGSLPLGSFLMFVLGFLASGFTVITRAMTADVADEVRLEQGRERAGVLFAFTTLVAKLSGAFSIGVSYMILGAVGYRSGAVNTPEAIQGMVLTYIIAPVVCMIVAAICLWGYPLTKARHAEIRRRLDLADAEAAAETQIAGGALT